MSKRNRHIKCYRKLPLLKMYCTIINTKLFVRVLFVLKEGKREGEQRDGWTSGKKGGRADAREEAGMFVCSLARRNSHPYCLWFSTCRGHPFPRPPWISILRGTPSQRAGAQPFSPYHHPMAKALLSRGPRSFSRASPVAQQVKNLPAV